MRAPDFAAQVHHQAAAIVASEHEASDQAFVNAISVEWTDEPEPGE